MFFRLLLLFTLIPLIELTLLLRLGKAFGWVETIFLVVGTGLVGAALARREGLRAWLDVRKALSQGKMPAAELIDALLIVVAGTLLVTPGVLTDVAGLLVLVPGFRQTLRNWVRAQIQTSAFQSHVHYVNLDQNPNTSDREPAPHVITLAPEDIEIRGDSGVSPPEKE